MLRQRSRTVLGLLCAAMLLSAAPAQAATFPGDNGKIAYSYSGTIYTISLGDPSGQQLVTHPDGGGAPSWSSDGSRLVFESDRGGERDLYVINADGSGEQRLTSNDAIKEEDPSFVDRDTVIFRADPDNGDEPSFSTVEVGGAPTSSYSVYRSNDPAVVDNFTEPEVSVDGELLFTDNFQVPGTSSFRSAAWTATGNGTATNVSGTAEPGFSGGWSPNGEEYLYTRRLSGCCNVEVFIDSDATAPVNLTNTARSETTPKFSPDGSMVVYGDIGGSDLFVRNADGSNEVKLPTGLFDARNPDWQPLGGGTTPPPPNPGPGPDPDPDPGPAPDDDAPDLGLAGKKQQSSHKKVVVEVSCDEACSVEARPKGKAKIKGRSAAAAKVQKKKLKLKPARADLAAGERRKLKLEFKGKKTKKLVKKSLSKGAKIKLKLQVIATDASGNARSDVFGVGLKK